MSHPHIDDAHKILISLGLPRAQQNERSALCLLALLDLRPGRKWARAQNPLIGITPIMDWIRDHYKKPMRRTLVKPCAARRCTSLLTRA